MSEAAITTAVENEEAKIAPLLQCRANTKRFEVLPGKYIVLPFTNQSNTELKFMLRLFSEMLCVLRVFINIQKRCCLPENKEPHSFYVDFGIFERFFGIFQHLDIKIYD